MERIGGTYQAISGTFLGRQNKTLSITLPFALTLKVQEEGLVLWPGEKRPSSSIKISPLSSYLPFIRSFLLEVARHLPGPPWKRTEEQRRAALGMWLKVAAVSALVVGLGLVHLVFFTNPSLPPLSVLIDLTGIAVAIGTILLTHPRIESGIQRRKWSRWIQGPELASLGWTGMMS
ncbi:MAG: hypothetical protein ACE5HJ_05755 [Thermoplasmata archaeon]